MAYRLSLLSDDLATELRRCAREQLDDAAGELRGTAGADPVTAIHEARKDLKKARSLLRLARPCLPADAYRGENARLRDIARALAGTRDADVLAQTAEGSRSAARAGCPPRRSISSAPVWRPMRRGRASARAAR